VVKLPMAPAHVPPLLLVLLLSVQCHAAASRSDLACSLNGVLVGGKCKCDAPWRGSVCAKLDILPKKKGGLPAYGFAPNVTSWGGNAIQNDAGGYDLWVSEMVGGCGLNTWVKNSRVRICDNVCFLRLYAKHDRFTKTCSGRIQENLNKTGPFSQVVHATAPSMDDAFVFKDEALPVWAHNAAPVRAPKTHTACPGCYYLFHIGAGKYTSPPEKCSGGHGPDADAAGSSSAAALPAAVAAAAGPCVGLCNKSSSLVHRSHGPEGPWEPLPSIGGARGEHTCYVCICFVPSLSWQSHRLSRDNLQSGCIETGLRCMCDFVVPCRDRLQQPRTCVCKERCGQTKQQQG